MRIIKSILCCLLLIPALLPGAELDENLLPAFRSIKPMEAYNYCKTLASKDFAGRLTGGEGYTAAAKWAAAKFRDFGLQSIGVQTGYLQPYSSPYTIIDHAEMALFLPAGQGEIPLKPGEDFLPLFYSDSGDTRAGLVFVGWGISAPEIKYDDYADVDVKDKFVLCFRGTPDRAEKRFTEHDHHRRRMQTAKNRGALGLFYIYQEPVANPNGDWIEGFTPAILSYEAADRILKEKGLNAAGLKKELEKNKTPRSFALETEIKYKVESAHYPDAVGYNVVGFVEGSDLVLRQECLVIGGHFDHCGQHMGFLFPGANDNASGSAVVMEIAAAFGKLEKKPKRSVVFVLFGGEEMGLTGSYYFADHLPHGINKVDAMFNFDMVGEGDGAVCVLNPEPPELKQTLEKADDYIHILRRTRFIRGVGVRSSDYAPFYKKGAACISFFSNGPHLHYHKTGDTIYRINPDIMADVSRLAFLTAYAWADR